MLVKSKSADSQDDSPAELSGNILDNFEYVRYNVHIINLEVNRMINTNATNFRKNVFGYLNQAVLHNDVININTKNGNAIVISEEDYNSLVETLYLMSHPKTAEEILEAMEESPSEGSVYDPEEDW